MPASWNDPKIIAERKRKAAAKAKLAAKAKAKPAAAAAELAGVELADVELADVELPEVEPAPAPGPAAALSAVGGRAVVSCLYLPLALCAILVALPALSLILAWYFQSRWS